MNNTVLTDMPENGQRISASYISPTIPSQRSVSLSAGKGGDLSGRSVMNENKQTNKGSCRSVY